MEQQMALEQAAIEYGYYLVWPFARDRAEPAKRYFAAPMGSAG
jgi:hypothetical protein